MHGTVPFNDSMRLCNIYHLAAFTQMGKTTGMSILRDRILLLTTVLKFPLILIKVQLYAQIPKGRQIGH